MILNIDFLTIFIGNNGCLFKKSKVKLIYTEVNIKLYEDQWSRYKIQDLLAKK